MASGPSRLEEALERIGRSVSNTHRAMLRAQMEIEDLREERRYRRWRRRRARGVPSIGFGIGAMFFVFGAYQGSHPEPALLVPAAMFGVISLGSWLNARRFQREEADEREAPAGEKELPAPVDPRVARVDALCEQLMQDLKEAPKAVRESLRKPEQAVTSLRDACHALVEREAVLRSRLSPEDDARLDREQRDLQSRVATESDAVTRERLQAALTLLEQQKAQRNELRTAASRLAAEHTRLLYTLESIATQVLKAKSADAASADVVGAGLRRDIEGWANEISAVADALEDVHAPPRSRERE